MTKYRKGESEENHGAEYIQEIYMYQTDKLQLPHKIEIFMYLNVFITDTGASVYSIGHIKGLIKNMIQAKGDSMKLPDGNKTEIEKLMI